MSCSNPTKESTSHGLDTGIKSATNYLVNAILPDGKFEYVRNFDAEAMVGREYNVLRHAGTLYAMTQSFNEFPNDTLKHNILLGAKYLKDTFLDSVPDNQNLLTFWSDPKITKARGPLTAKLGGAGLGLVALSDIEKIKPGFTSLDTLRAIGRFILFMQDENGHFTSRFVPSSGGKDIRWRSLYYPGEACLGLIKLYHIDPNPEWIKAAIGCLTYLANERHQKSEYPIDHWALIATAELFNLKDIKLFLFH